MKLLKDANKTVRVQQRAISNVIRRDSKLVGPVIKALKKARLNILHVTIDVTSYNISISGSRADLEIMFGTLRRMGLEPVSRPTENHPTYSSYWNFPKPEGERLCRTVWISFASTSCKRVKVGTRLEEVDVYDVVCTD